MEGTRLFRPIREKIQYSFSTEEIIKEYEDCGNFEEVARRLGISEVIAFKRYRKIYPKKEGSYSHPFERKDITPEDVGKAYKELGSYRQVAKIFGVSRDTIEKRYKKYLASL